MQPTHYFTGSGALCGVLVVVHWSISRTEVTCPRCRALLCLTAEEMDRAAASGGSARRRAHPRHRGAR